jgi:hypothetical protein
MRTCPTCQATLEPTRPHSCPACGADLRNDRRATASQGGPFSGGGGGTAWDGRDRAGFLPALVETTRQVLTGPTAFFGTVDPRVGLASPLVYGLIVGTIGALADAVYGVLFHGLYSSFLANLPGGSDMGRLAPFFLGGANLFVSLVFAPVGVLLGMFIGSGIIHVMLLILGEGKATFEGTFASVAYSQAATLLRLVPVCGGIIGGIYALVLIVIGLTEVHRIPQGKAIAAVVIPVLLVCCCCVGAAFMIGGALAGLVGGLTR